MDRKGFGTLIGLLLTLIIVCLIFYVAAKVYFGDSTEENPAVRMEKPVKEQAQEVGIDTTTQKAVLHSTVKQIKEIERQQQESADQILRQMSGEGVTY